MTSKIHIMLPLMKINNWEIKSDITKTWRKGLKMNTKTSCTTLFKHKNQFHNHNLCISRFTFLHQWRLIQWSQSLILQITLQTRHQLTNHICQQLLKAINQGFQTFFQELVLNCLTIMIKINSVSWVLMKFNHNPSTTQILFRNENRGRFEK